MGISNEINLEEYCEPENTSREIPCINNSYIISREVLISNTEYNNFLDTILSKIVYIKRMFIFFLIVFFTISFLVHFSDILFNVLLIQNAYGQLQQQTEFIKYHHRSNFIIEFEVPVDNNDRGLKGITTDSKNNVWFYHNTNTSSTIIIYGSKTRWKSYVCCKFMESNISS